jgi:hypothetical protein
VEAIPPSPSSQMLLTPSPVYRFRETTTEPDEKTIRCPERYLI